MKNYNEANQYFNLEERRYKAHILRLRRMALGKDVAKELYLIGKMSEEMYSKYLDSMFGYLGDETNWN